MNTYKLRAECLHDILKLIKLCPISAYNIDCKRIPDIEFSFSSTYSIDEIRELLKRMPDSHVMLETVAPNSKYTGKRVCPY